ncbi:MAG: aspartyl/glutamyl-tRNA amidotransferase subunit C [Candidatus Actinomarina sp.]
MADKIDIKNVAKLASIKLNQEEEDRLESDLSMIIEHFDALSKMDLPDDKISIHPLGMSLNSS